MGMWLGMVCGSSAWEGWSTGFRVWCQGQLTHTADLRHLIISPASTQPTPLCAWVLYCVTIVISGSFIVSSARSQWTLITPRSANVLTRQRGLLPIIRFQDFFLWSAFDVQLPGLPEGCFHVGADPVTSKSNRLLQNEKKHDIHQRKWEEKTSVQRQQWHRSSKHSNVPVQFFKDTKITHNSVKKMLIALLPLERKTDCSLISQIND